SIGKTMDLIDNVTTASKEQQSSIENINENINSLDSRTQENASVASESNTIAQQTNSMAQEIVEKAQRQEFLGKDLLTRRKKSIDLSYNKEEKRKIEILLKK
ncbi:MAG: methyl-accepting chemotaxis protein, partial [Campylobacterota bacterium]|nr:methyl-accepting chemotaxis protein [Campylobacterota bacterium]